MGFELCQEIAAMRIQGKLSLGLTCTINLYHINVYQGHTCVDQE